MRARSGGVCEACGQARATNASHRVGEGVGGLWCPSNIVDMCGSGTTGCHGLVHASAARAGEARGPRWAREQRGWRLESHEDPLALPWLHWSLGWVLADVEGGFRQVEEVWALAALQPVFPR